MFMLCSYYANDFAVQKALFLIAHLSSPPVPSHEDLAKKSQDHSLGKSFILGFCCNLKRNISFSSNDFHTFLILLAKGFPIPWVSDMSFRPQSQ